MAPPNREAFEKALLLLQPLWVRVGQFVAILFAAVGVGFWVAAHWPDTPRIVLRIVVGIPTGILCLCLWSIRRNALQRQVERLMSCARRARYNRVELYEDGLVVGGEWVPWSDVSEGAEVDYAEATFLAVRAHGSWSILPAAHITQGDFNGARSLMMRKLDDKLRIVIV
jgi:hypothetical protein